MNDSNLANCDAQIPEMPLDRDAGQSRQLSRPYSTDRVRHLFDTSDYPLVEAPAAGQVREEQGVYVLDLLADEQYDCKPEHLAAASDHAKHLGKAQLLLGEALDLARLASAALCEAGDCRATQTETACKVIEEKVSKAYNRIDKHDRRHTNLFLAYCDLKDRADSAKE